MPVSRRTRRRAVSQVGCAVVLVGLVVGAVPACTAGSAPEPEQAARAFLDAVGEGRAVDALGYLRTPPSDRTLLTDAVLADAVRQAPITDVTASARGGGDRRRLVDVSYEIGGRRVTDTYATVQVGDRWLVDETLPAVPGFDDRPGGVAVTVSGLPVAPLRVYDPFNGRWSAGVPSDGAVLTSASDPGATAGTPVLPGRYQFSLDHPLLDVERAEFTVTSLHAPVTMADQAPRTRMTDEGKTRTVAAAETALTTCVQVTTLAACGLGFSDTSIIGSLARDADPSFSLVENTATWSVDPGSTDLSTTAPEWSPTCARTSLRDGSPGACVSGIHIELRVTAKTTMPDVPGRTTPPRRATESLSEVIVGYTADISDPDNIRVKFWGDG